MAVDEFVELKFRLDDGSDIGPNQFTASATVASLKQEIIGKWPKDKKNRPEDINHIKLIHAGKILENNKTVAESRNSLSEDIITMHVVVPPPLPDKHIDKLHESRKNVGCSCTIL